MIDSLDEQLIHLLEQDAGQSSKALAKRLNASPATIRRRIRKLVQEDVIHIRALLNPSKIGLMAAVLTLDVDHRSLGKAIKQLASKDNVVWLSTITGRFDIMALLRIKSTDELFAFLQEELPKIQGVKNSETFVCLHVLKH